MASEVTTSSALPLGKLGLGLGKGYAYTAGGAIVGTFFGTVLVIAAGTLVLGWLIVSAKKTEKAKPKN